jgi:2-methylcitrate dehydratase PrpD
MSNLRYRVPRDPNEARFSLPYCLAAALEDGMLTVGSFSQEAVTREMLVPLMERVTLRLDPELKADRAVTESFERGTVTVTLKDGRVLKQSVLTPRGHPGAPLSDDDLAHKFRDCATGVLPPTKVEEALDLLASFGTLETIAPLIASLKV